MRFLRIEATAGFIFCSVRSWRSCLANTAVVVVLAFGRYPRVSDWATSGSIVAEHWINDGLMTLFFFRHRP